MTLFDQRRQQVGIQVNLVTTSSGTSIPLFKPPRAPHFTDRKIELEKLLKDLRLGKVVTICGTGGMGKTALVAEAIWELAPDNQVPQRFPDGIVFHTFYNQPSVEVALETIALAFGEEPKPTPAAGAQRALSGKQVLLVLDGAEAADDLTKIHASTGGCAVLVTSRRSDDAFEDWSDLKPLATEDSVELLQAWGQHQADDPEIVRAICEMVGNLPLAVRLAGFYLLHRKVDANHYLEWLQASSLDALDHGQRRERSVPILLQRSLEQIGEEAKSTLALIGRLALAPFDSIVIAEASGIPVHAAEDWLGHLVNWGFLNVGEHRYQVVHVLIHTYARERLTLDDEGLRRLVAYFLALIQTESPKGLPGYRCLDRERAHLLYLIGVCIEQEHWEDAKQLVDGLRDYLNLQGYITEWIAALDSGILATRKMQDRRSEAAFTGLLGIAYRKLGQVEKAIGYFEQALAISREIGDRQKEGVCLDNLGTAFQHLGQVDKAIGYSEQALAISREIGKRQDEGLCLGNLGNAYGDLGQLDKAIGHYEQALAISREIGDRQKEGAWLGSLGEAYRDLGQVEKAIGHYEQALAISREIGARRNVGYWLGGLGNAYRDLGQLDQAIGHYEQALAISREIGYRQNEGAGLGNLGEAYRDLGLVEKARQCFRDALAIFEDIKSPDAEQVRRWLSDLG